jgi:membrane protein
MVRLAQYWRTLQHLFQHEIWRPSALSDHTPRGKLHAFLRIVSITWGGIGENNTFSRAAALSFSSLLGLGPLVAIAMLVAGFAIGQQDDNLAVTTMNKLIKFIAPQIAQYEEARGNSLPENAAQGQSDVLTATTMEKSGSTTAPVATEGEVEINPELVKLIDGFVASASSPAVAGIGALTLILIVLQLFTSIETAFNEIWGVHRGRSWLMRVVFYWTVLTLGAVLFFAAVTGVSASTFLKAFEERMPFGSEMVALLNLMLPAGSLLLLVAILTIFYRTIPNTRVHWKAAFYGAVVVTLLIVINNFLAFLYVERVVLNTSLYGSLGILPIMMFGLYIFWFFVLLGGQVSYAVQNVNFRNSQAAWTSLAESMRERLSLIVLLTICRRFHDCLPPCTASQLGKMLTVPAQVLNECLNRLVNMRLLSPVPPPSGEAATDFRYQPSRPLSRITLADFKRLDDDFGEDPNGPTLKEIDPIVSRYDTETTKLTHSEFFQKSIESLFSEHPIDASRPPFAFGEPRSGC